MSKEKTFKEKFGIRGASIASHDVIKGIVLNMNDGGVAIVTASDDYAALVETPQTQALYAYMCTNKTSFQNAKKQIEEVAKESRIMDTKKLFFNTRWGTLHCLSCGRALFSDEKILAIYPTPEEAINTFPYSWPPSTYLVTKAGASSKQAIADFLKSNEIFLDTQARHEIGLLAVKQVSKGRVINPFALSPDDFSVDAIITAYCRISRFAGQTEGAGVHGYTVGHHVLSMVRLLEDPQEQTLALLHEYFEGMSGIDMITPMKYAREEDGDYLKAEKEAERNLCFWLDVPALLPPHLKEMDRRLCATEGEAFFAPTCFTWSSIAAPFDKKVLIPDMPTEEVKAELWHWFKKLNVEEKIERFVEQKKSTDSLYKKLLDADKGAPEKVFLETKTPTKTKP